MGIALLGLAGVVLVPLVPILFQHFSGRNHRILANQEADLLAKLTELDPDSEAAQPLREIINARVAVWHGKMFKPAKDDEFGRQLQESMRPRPGGLSKPALVGVVIGMLIFSVVSVAGLVATMRDSDIRDSCLLLMC